MPDLTQKALDLHKQLQGKIQIQLKQPLKSQEDLTLLYSPGVAAASTAISEDPAQVWDLTWKSNTIAIVTDGSAVLGLGNIGPEAALPVMEGKSLLFKEFADINCIPICLQTQDPDEIINIISNLAPTFGGIALEDISAPRCFEIEEKLKAKFPNLPIFHDDQHGTAIVILAGLINAAKVTGKDLKSSKIVINGAGAAAIATTKLLLKFGITNIILCDSTGIIFENREEGMNPHKIALSKVTNPQKIQGQLADALPNSDIFIGVSKANLLTPDMIKTMNPDPVIFALANPDPEIMPDLAKQAGAKIVATGRADFPNQVNNVLVFPGIFKGALQLKTQITDDMKIKAAQAIANMIPNPTPDLIVPPASDKTVADTVAQAIIQAN